MQGPAVKKPRILPDLPSLPGSDRVFSTGTDTLPWQVDVFRFCYEIRVNTRRFFCPPRKKVVRPTRNEFFKVAITLRRDESPTERVSSVRNVNRSLCSRWNATRSIWISRKYRHIVGLSSRRSVMATKSCTTSEARGREDKKKPANSVQTPMMLGGRCPHKRSRCQPKAM